MHYSSQKSQKEVVNVEHFFNKLLVGYILIRIYISLLRTSFNCKCKCEKVSKKSSLKVCL